MGISIFANHAHVFPESINPAGMIPRLLRLMEECGIEQQICFAPFPHQCDGKDLEPNAWLAGEISKQPSLKGFGTIDFRRKDLAQQVKRVAELGLLGLKLHPNAQEFDLTEARSFEVYGAAQEHRLFCSFHSGVHQSRLKETAVLKFDEVAWEFPNLRFSLEHVGGYHFFREGLAVIFNHVPPPWDKSRKCNVFGGLASVFTQHQNRFWYLRPDQLLELYQQVGADQLIFGLDFPYNLERETRMGIETLKKLGLPEPDLAKILGGNLRRELNVAGR